MQEQNRIIIHGMSMLQEKQWYPNQAVVVEEGKITAIIPENMLSHHLPAQVYKFKSDHYLVPGFVDLHIHGAHGHDVMDATPESLHAIAKTLAKEGVTSFLATTMTMGEAEIEAALKNVAHVMSQSNSGVVGVHLEGPFIAKEKIGAQHPEHLLAPELKKMLHWQRLSNNNIRICTLAPELPNALELIQELKNLNIVAGIGHTNATFEETKAAINAGATYATHLFNAMRMITQREPGATGALLLDERVYAELIVDNMHLHPAIVELALRIKGVLHLILITDAMRAKGLKDGVYDIGGQEANVRNGKATIDNGALAGSTLHMSEAIKNINKFKNIDLIEAIRMASINPAHVIGMSESKGSITVGKDADLVVLSKDLDVHMTIRGGVVVYQANNAKAYV